MKLASTAAACVLVFSTGLAAANDAPPGAASCSGCHAIRPGAETPVPRIHGRPAAETVAAMDGFRTDKTPSTVMNRIAKGFTESETRAIGDWLATQK